MSGAHGRYSRPDREHLLARLRPRDHEAVQGIRHLVDVVQRTGQALARAGDAGWRHRLPAILVGVAIFAVPFGAGAILLQAAGPVTIASDSFNRTLSNGWGPADVGGAWTVVDTAARWSVSPGVGTINVAAGGQERAVLGGV